MRTLEEKTRVYKHFSKGWTAETTTTENNQTFRITTLKRSSGKISTYAQACEAGKTSTASIISFSPFRDESIKLESIEGNATEKAVKDLHFKSLALFDKMVQDGDIMPNKKETPEVGTILFLDGYDSYKGSHGNKHVIYEIDHSGNFGINFKTVELDTLKLSVKDHIQPYSQKFGIGTYFEPNYKFKGSESELMDLVLDARKQAEEEAKKEEAAQIMRSQIRAGKIEEGKKLVSIPENAKSVIVAKLIQDESDSQTDYYGESTQDVIYLAFSTHNRDIFSEMRKACANSDNEDIKKFTQATEVNNNGETKAEYLKKMRDYYKNDKEAARYWNPSDEHREKYSMGRGYYLMAGPFSRSGWRIQKETYRFDSESFREDLYIAAAEGRYMIPSEDTKPEIKKAVSASGIEYVDYSEKAFAIIGETKPLKDKLKELGGKFNFRLKCGAGWIFSKKKEAEVLEALNLPR